MSCGTDRELLRLMIKDIIDQLINDGTIQGGLLTCDGDMLYPKQKMKDCSSADAADAALDAKMEQLRTDLLAALEAKKDTFLTNAALSSGYELLLTLNDGTVVKAPLADLCKCGMCQPTEYYATLTIKLGDASCDGKFQRVAYAFHPEDLRDPAADIQLVDVNGNVIGYIYSTSAGAHTIGYMVERDDGNLDVVGYALASPIVRVYENSACCNKQFDLFGGTP